MIMMMMLLVIVLLLIVNTNALRYNIRMSSSASILTKTNTNNDNKYHSFKSKYGDYNIRYKYIKKASNNNNILSSFTNKSTPIVCIHGFGGNADQFRKNLPVLSEKGYDSYAMDLLGYGK